VSALAGGLAGLGLEPDAKALEQDPEKEPQAMRRAKMAQEAQHATTSIPAYIRTVPHFAPAAR
jgi:hypothetical protein